MSRVLIAQYLNDLSRLRQVSGTHRESVVREAFKNPTIREKFNTYRFANHREKVIDLLARVTRVSVDTQRIVEAMRTQPR